MISLDYSVLYQMILFVVLWLILRELLFKPYINVLDERAHRTVGAEHDSTELEQEGARLRAQYEEKIAQAQAAGYAAKEAVVQEGRQQREKILSQARDEAMSLLEGVRRELATELEKERQLGVAEIETVARQMASKILGRQVA